MLYENYIVEAPSNLQLRVVKYKGADFLGRYMVRDVCRGESTYLCTDGVLRRWALTKCGNGVISLFRNRKCAKRALDKYNNKGNVMNKKNLTTGMIVTIRDEIDEVYDYTVALGHKQGDILIYDNGYLRLTAFDDNMVDTGRNFGNYTVLKIVEPIRTKDTFSKDTNDFKEVYTRDVSPTVMTIADLEKKLGITNLQIKD